MSDTEWESIILVPEDGDEEFVNEGGPRIVKAPRETFDAITTFLADPSNGVRLARPNQKGTTDGSE